MEVTQTSITQSMQHFRSEENCIAYLAGKRWPGGKVICPTCGSDRVSYLAKQRRWQCSARHPKRQFSIKVGTIFEDSPLGLDKWLPALWMVANKGVAVSAWQLQSALNVTQKTAWFMLHRIRLAMQG